MSEPERWYPSKIDTWLAVVLAIAPIACVVAAVAVLAAGEFTASAIALALGPCAFIAAVYWGLLLPMRYGISADALVVRHGLVRQRIALGKITEVFPTRNPLSSPALSLDRLHVRFGAGLLKSTMISPVDKEAFLAELAARAGLRREGERLVRDPGPLIAG